MNALKRMFNGTLGNILKFSAATIISGIISFLTIPILTRLMTPEEYGQLNLFISTTNLLAIVISIGLLEYYLRFYYEHENELGKLNFFCLGVGTINCIVVFFAIIVLCIPVMAGGDKLTNIFLGIVALGLYYMKIVSADARYSSSFFKYTVVTVCSSVFFRTIAIPLAVLKVEYNFMIKIESMLFLILAVIFIFTKGRKKYSFGIPSNFIKEIKFGILSWPAAMATYGNTYLTQRLIQKLTSYHELGIYNGTNVFIGIINILQVGLKNFWSPFVYKNYEYNEKKIRVIQKYAMIVICMMANLLIICRSIIYWLLGEDYLESKSFFAFVVTGAVIITAASLSGIGISIKCKGHINTGCMAMLLGVNLLLLYFIVPHIGIAGAGIANLISSLLYYIVQTVLGQRYYRTIECFWKEGISIGSMIILSIANWYIEDDIYLAVFGMIVIGSVCVGYKKEFKVLIKDFLCKGNK